MKKAWLWLVYWGFALVFFVLTLVVVRWTIDFVTWSALDSGWAQAIGTVAAIGVAFGIGAKQSRDAIRAIVFGYDHATRRKYEAYRCIAQAAKEHCATSLHTFPDGGFAILQLAITQLDKKRESLMGALDSIPIHEVGTFQAVEALTELRISMGHLNTAITKANDHIKSFGGTTPFFIAFDTAVIRLNCKMAIAQADHLMAALGMPFGESAEQDRAPHTTE